MNFGFFFTSYSLMKSTNIQKKWKINSCKWDLIFFDLLWEILQCFYPVFLQAIIMVNILTNCFLWRWWRLGKHTCQCHIIKWPWQLVIEVLKLILIFLSISLEKIKHQKKTPHCPETLFERNKYECFWCQACSLSLGLISTKMIKIGHDGWGLDLIDSWTKLL